MLTLIVLVVKLPLYCKPGLAMAGTVKASSTIAEEQPLNCGM